MDKSSILSTKLLKPGTLLAEQYKIQRLIGSGGSASVYLATDIENDIQVAVKMLHSSFSENRKLVQRFLQEAQILVQINHPHVIKVYNVLVYDGHIFSIIEYCAGGSLADRVFANKFTRDSLAELITDITSGLDAIHDFDIVHRDLKPSNILFDEEGVLKIADFGIARFSDSSLTQTHERIGSPQYIAPEVWLGKEITPATDYYALGILLFELVCGEAPFNSAALEDCMSAHIEEEPPAICEFWPDSPSWFTELVSMLLEKDPKKRTCSSRAIRIMVNPSSTMSLKRIVLDEIIEKSEEVEPFVESSSSRERKGGGKKERKSYILSLHASDLLSVTRKISKRKRRHSRLTVQLPKDAAIIFEVEPPSRDIYYFGLFLISLQVMDGFLTSQGMLRYGTFAEGNPILRQLMETFSPTQTLFFVKAFAIMAVVLITIIAQRSRMVRDMIGLLSCIYLCVAILPWAYLLFLS